jgi:hypothetical protein
LEGESAGAWTYVVAIGLGLLGAWGIFSRRSKAPFVEPDPPEWHTNAGQLDSHTIFAASGRTGDDRYETIRRVRKLGRRWDKPLVVLELAEPIGISMAEARYWACYELISRGIEAKLEMSRPDAAKPADEVLKDYRPVTDELIVYETPLGFAYHTMEFLTHLATILPISDFQTVALFSPDYEAELSVNLVDIEHAFGALQSVGIKLSRGDRAKMPVSGDCSGAGEPPGFPFNS